MSADLALTRGQAADRRAALVREHLDVVWRFLRRLGLGPADADDVAQEVFLTSVGKLDVIEPGKEKSFLFGVAVRIASRARRAQQGRAAHIARAVDPDEVSSPTPGGDEIIEQKQARAVLDEILAEMTEELRTTFVLYELEELTMAEIATVTDVPPGTVASRLRRAREQFQNAARSRQP